MSGTVNISRGIWHDTAFKPEPFTEREAFMWIIMEASYKAREKRVGNVTVNLDRGQVATSVRFMCEAWDWSKSRVDRFIKRLEKRDMVKAESGTGINVLTVCKYDDYQNKPKDSGTPNSEKRDSSGTAAGQQRDKPNKGLIPDAIQEQEEEPCGSLPAIPPAIDEIAQAVSAYNATAERTGWPKVQTLSPARRKSLKARLSEADGVTGWEVALSKAEASSFLTGRTDRPFRASFDFIAKQANFTKIMEGNYDDRTGPNQTGTSAGRGGSRAHNSLMGAFADVAHRGR